MGGMNGIYWINSLISWSVKLNQHCSGYGKGGRSLGQEKQILQVCTKMAMIGECVYCIVQQFEGHNLQCSMSVIQHKGLR
jgi:hypothetical protein